MTVLHCASVVDARKYDVYVPVSPDMRKIVASEPIISPVVKLAERRENTERIESSEQSRGWSAVDLVAN